MYLLISLFALVLLPVAAYFAYRWEKKAHPELLGQYDKILYICLIIYMFIVGAYVIFEPAASPMPQNERKASQEFFQPSAAPKRGQGAGFPEFK